MTDTTVRVHVQDQYGNPIEGARVWSSKLNYPISIGPPRTDSSGNATVRMPAGEKRDYNTDSPYPRKYECVDCKTIIIGGETPVITFVMKDLAPAVAYPRIDGAPIGADPRTWGPSNDMSTEQADAVVRAGHQVYIKCRLPILNLLPGLPYAPWIPILPGFALTREP